MHCAPPPAPFLFSIIDHLIFFPLSTQVSPVPFHAWCLVILISILIQLLCSFLRFFASLPPSPIPSSSPFPFSLLLSFPSPLPCVCACACLLGRTLFYFQLLRRNPSTSAPSSTVSGSSTPQQLPFAPVVMSRLCLALAAVAVRAPNGVKAYVREAFALSQV